MPVTRRPGFNPDEARVSFFDDEGGPDLAAIITVQKSTEKNDQGAFVTLQYGTCSWQARCADLAEARTVRAHITAQLMADAFLRTRTRSE